MASLAGCAFAPDARAKRRSSPPARAARALSSRATLRRQGGAARLAASTSAPGSRRGSPRAGPVSVRALVNVDLGPSAILGASVARAAPAEAMVAGLRVRSNHAQKRTRGGVFLAVRRLRAAIGGGWRDQGHLVPRAGFTTLLGILFEQ